MDVQSEDDFYDENTEDDIYDENTEDDFCDETYYRDDDDDEDFNADEFTSSSTKEKKFTILNGEDIRQSLEGEIAEVLTVLSVPRETAITLLCRYNWDLNTVHEEWFADEEKVRKACGLLENPINQQSLRKEEKFFCGICLERKTTKTAAVVAACCHVFCKTCWTSYISTAINDGRGCLVLRCPEPSCDAAIGQAMIFSLVSDEDKKKYDNYLLRSYVEDRENTKWCPAPGCDRAVVAGSGSSFDVICNCSYGFCWNCLEEAHSPVDCETTAKWILKNSSESENTNWILANSKPCPRCKRPIEKNSGCMHMTCTPPCEFHFCWLCLGAWSEHGEITGGYYACNRYEKAKADCGLDEAEMKREIAKNCLEKYTHYYERWSSNDSSRKRALIGMHNMQTIHLEKLSKIQAVSETSLEFIIHGWLQIVECRRVLKWTYAYGYYLAENECAKKEFFQYVQGEAEVCLERLHQCVEMELSKYLEAEEEGPSKDFVDFRCKLIGLTDATRTYFDNLVRALQNGLSDVQKHNKI